MHGFIFSHREGKAFKDNTDLSCNTAPLQNIFPIAAQQESVRSLKALPSLWADISNISVNPCYL